MQNRILILFIYILLINNCLLGQSSKEFSFVNISVQDGLSNNAVTCVTQDHYGFMWMGTYDGLNRYDGRIFKIFRNRLKDSTSLIDNHITVVKEGKPNELWVGTLKGVSLFDYHIGAFRPVWYLPQNEKEKKIVNSRVKDLIADKNGNVLVGTENNGLLFKKAGDQTFHQILYNNRADWNISAITKKDSNSYYIGIRDLGIFEFQLQSSKLTLFATVGKTATRLLKDSVSNKILVGTEEGLYFLNTKKDSLALFSKELRNFSITNILRDKEGYLWVTTDGNGMAVLSKGGDPASDFIFVAQGNDVHHLQSSAVYGVFEDNLGRKWIATIRGGVSFLHAHPPLFTTIRRDPFNPNSLISNFTLSFCEDEKHNIWIGTDGAGMSYWNPTKGTFKNYVHKESVPTSISGKFVVSVLKDHDDQIWVATFNGGIDRKKKNSDEFIHYQCFNPYRQKVDKNLWKLYEDSYHRIWAGSTMGDALFKYNPKLDKFEVFDPKLINIHTIYEDSKGNLWAGNYDELIKIDTLKKKHTYTYVGYPVRAILEDHNGILWVGTEGGGLLAYNESKKTFKTYSQQDGLPSNAILNLLEDNTGRIWCSTYNGLSLLDIRRQHFENFDVNDGLQGNQFNYNAAVKLSDGSFIFGGLNGFNHFNPTLIYKTLQPVDLIVTDFFINGQPIEKTKFLSDSQTVESFQGITIPYNQASISIHFAGLNYDAPKSVEYGYYLEGWDKTWIKAGNTPVAIYSKLIEGRYKLHLAIMGANGKPILASQKIISLTVLPPWYRSWWAYCLYFLVICSLIYAYQRYRRKQTRLLYEMKLTRLNAQTERELNERKIAFFTDISHEFRTMLTLIINPIKELMSQGNEIGHSEIVKTAYKNSRRMLRLISQLLLFRKVDNEAIQMNVSRIDLSQLCKDVFESFSFQATSNNIDYQLDLPRETNSDDPEGEPLIKGVFIYGDLEKLEILLFNLLSNAFKYTPNGKSIKLRLYEDDCNAYLELADSGLGIPNSEKENIFKKFYQQPVGKGRAKNGFGIGLFLVKDFVTRHHGSINFESEVGEGTTFYLEFKKGKVHFAGMPISEEIDADSGLATEILEVDKVFPDYLPKEQALVEQASRQPVAKEKNSEDEHQFLTEKKTILIADDNAEIRQFVAQLFADTYQIVQIDNGLDVLKCLEDRSLDLIILDLVMPGKLGDEVCQEIKSSEAWRHIPVIMLTGEASSEVKLRCVESGADDYITKPFEKELLIARVNNLLRVRTNLQKYFFNEITLKENSQKISEDDKQFLDQCIKVVEEHLGDDKFDIKLLADIMCMSHSALYKKIHLISGYSVNGFVRFVRLRKAAEIFVNGKSNVSETAFLVGFSDVKYFRTQFQKLFDMTPSNYIKKYRKSFEGKYTRKNM